MRPKRKGLTVEGVEGSVNGAGADVPIGRSLDSRGLRITTSGPVTPAATPPSGCVGV